MTLNKLIKELQKLQAKGLGRAKVTCDKESLYDGNGTFNISDVKSVSHGWVRVADGDGFSTFNKDGTERTTSCIVFSGENSA